jgi:hypothetical protein
MATLPCVIRFESLTAARKQAGERIAGKQAQNALSAADST